MRWGESSRNSTGICDVKLDDAVTISDKHQPPPLGFGLRERSPDLMPSCQIKINMFKNEKMSVLLKKLGLFWAGRKGRREFRGRRKTVLKKMIKIG